MGLVTKSTSPYTASFAFFEAIWEMVALSMADGMARLTNKPQCVIVHVDVGTQGLAAAVHNASCGRAPVLIFAGLSPYTLEGEYRGSRTEYIHWIQDVPDQKQIIAQYCRYTGEIKGGRNVKQMVNRALQFATSDPKGPVYLYGAREAMEEDIEPYYLNQQVWHAVDPAALPQAAVKTIAEDLVKAKEPLLIVGYTGRNIESVRATVTLADKVPTLRVLDTGGSDMCFPANHPAALGLRYGSDPAITTADFILVIDCDVPWIPTLCNPKPGTKVIHVDVDPLKQQMPVHYLPAVARYKADSATSLNQINDYLGSIIDLSDIWSSAEALSLAENRAISHRSRWNQIKDLAKLPTDLQTPINPHILGEQIRAAVPRDTIFAVEAVTLATIISDQIAAILPKTWINCGGGGLGWSGGGALGIKLASDFEHRDTDAGDLTGTNKGKFVCSIVGDGTFLFSVPGSEGSKVDNKALNISFDPSPDYPGIAKAATGGKAWTGTVGTVAELLEQLPRGVAAVKAGQCAVLEVKLGDTTAATATNKTGLTPGEVALSTG
ncbi:acetolactate synthase [Cladophialophora carrionii]|uniref:Acetolactate synthase n=1 Tax=Cladophialophora carrionii TaxID=86049 RepID=A0A1C1C8E2_9EURO|nr:acetolactate synthase [Cladophialophora carrionii]